MPPIGPSSEKDHCNFQLIESYGNEIKIKYTKNIDGLDIQYLGKRNFTWSPKSFFTSVFLPQGYPTSVSDDYASYQFYDTIQAFCSRITGTITTKAILKSVGVGDPTATPLAAATTWIFKDGTGMFGSIIFAWWKGTDFDSNCKKWRLFADILNDSAMFIEMLLPSLPNTTYFLCLTTAMKAGVGVSGSATRAAITQHQAIKGNMADVSAKDGSQETAINLFASVFALLGLTLAHDERYDWVLFTIFTIFHLLANYMAVKSLKFNTLNATRYNILLKKYFKTNTVPNPTIVNNKEPVILGFGFKNSSFFGFDITVGKSLTSSMKNCEISYDDLFKIYRNKNYLLVPNLKRRRIDVVLFINESPETILIAYYNAALLGLAISTSENNFTANEAKDEYSVKELQKILTERNETKCTNMIQIMMGVLRLIEKKHFLDKLKAAGWRTDAHSIKIDDWRLRNEC